VIAGSRRLPVSNISIRVPWHDNGWNGTVCRHPSANTSCLVLSRIAGEKRDGELDQNAGRALPDLPQAAYPPCVAENVSILSPAEIHRTMSHPYIKRSDLHADFAPTPFTHPPYTAACIPFRWMLHDVVFGNEEAGTPALANALQLGIVPEREPELGFKTSWVQDRENQLVMLDTFFSAVQPEQSLCFFYAKQTPMTEDPRRTLIGAARVLKVSGHTEYHYKTKTPRLRGILWERLVTHSLRPDQKDGFLLPYREVLEAAEKNGSIRPSDYAVQVPDEHWDEFSYASAHVTSDAAIQLLLDSAGVLHRVSSVLEGSWTRQLAWIDQQLNALWRMRGPYPGFGSALRAFGLEHGTLIAHAIGLRVEVPESIAGDPWDELDRVMDNPGLLPIEVARTIGAGYRLAWKQLAAERRELLKLLSRFALTPEQAERFFEPSVRQKAGIETTDSQLLGNPYLLYEADRGRLDSVPVTTIDRGLFPDSIIAERYPVPAPSAQDDAVDRRRVRALIVDALEEAASAGHTLQPEPWIIDKVRGRELRPPCPLGIDLMAVVRPELPPTVKAATGETLATLQLDRYVKTGALISQELLKRAGGKRHSGDYDWRALVDKALPTKPLEDASGEDAEERARSEKAAALAELYASRFSVLVGSAGTGKTTLLRVLCGIPEINNAGILLLAPTGKARVRLEIGTGRSGGLTLAQFLQGYGRYDGETGRYLVTGSANRCSLHKTVIVDEASMLTEEQLASLLDVLAGVHRLVLVGDTRQLPPIGAGRPFVDAVAQIAPASIESLFPRVGTGYAELTITRRQAGQERDDVLLARSFVDGPPDPGIDEVWHRVLSGNSDRVKIVSWNAPEQLDKLFIDVLVEELGLSGPNDQTGFEQQLGGLVSNGWVYFNARSSTPPRAGSCEKAEDWQVLVPVRGHSHGVDSLNRLIQQRFRSQTIASANRGYDRRIPKPFGPQQIVYGDKVINLKNGYRYDTWPKGDKKPYLANGDIGILVGQFKTAKMKSPPWKIEVEFATQPGTKFGFSKGEFGDEGTPPLELAYALTVHKTQGSEFGKTFVVLPNPCWLLSRELLYTALTRQTERLVILCQGDFRDFRRYSTSYFSDVASRLTNLFRSPRPKKVAFEQTERILEDRLIHRTERGELVRSKSEVIIADKLHSRGIDYGYETPVQLSNGHTRYPDFTIEDAASGRVYYWEHLGMLRDSAYRARWQRKREAYRAAGILTPEEGTSDAVLIVTEDAANGGLDSAKIAELIDSLKL
jgi:hypothetical protein